MIYTLRNLTCEELSLFQHFIYYHWNKNHIFTQSKELINFQHYNHQKNEYNFIIAFNNKTKEIDGLVGYISTGQYDPLLADQGDYWGAIWKIRSDVENSEIKILGLLLWEEVVYNKEVKSFGGIGLSNTAKSFYKKSRFKTGILNQYYILREQNKPYTIAVAPLNTNRTSKKEIKYIRKIDLSEEIDIKPYYRPYKSITYLINRYKFHPIYKYEFWEIANQCVLVTRKITIANQSALRIVDCLGTLDNLPDLYSDFQIILSSENAEYIDFLNYGIDEQVFFNMGFQKLNLDGEIIIPNYFEPFEQRNVHLDCVYKADYNYIIFKGDSDQDRPNNI